MLCLVVQVLECVLHGLHAEVDLALDLSEDGDLGFLVDLHRCGATGSWTH